MATKHKIVLINGAPGVGKSWLAEHLMRRLNGESWGGWTSKRPAARIGFADGIRKTVQTMFHLPKDMDDSNWSDFKRAVWSTEDGHINGRMIMIEIGTMGRRLNPNFWVDNLFMEIKEIDSKHLTGRLWIVDDWGFQNEFDQLRIKEEVELLTVYIGKDITTAEDIQAERPLLQFEGDSRFNLSRYCYVRQPDSSSALERTLVSIKNRNW